MQYATRTITMNRREFLRLTAVVAGSVTVTGCTPVYDRLAQLGAPALPNMPPVAARDFAALRRLTYGPRPEEQVRVAEIGLAAWIEEQLSPDSIEDNRAALRIRRFDSLRQNAGDLWSWRWQEVVAELRQATIIRQIYSRRQLYEQVVEFWSDHFNITTDKEPCWSLKPVDDRTVIRPHALGNFHTLLSASAHSPAMLVYLDNQANEKSHPNENYARELLELHTLGVGSGYTQQDVMELARCLTGWGVREGFRRGEFVFEAERHDNGVKVVLGEQIQPNGQQEAEAVIERLAADPRTARFIARKLVRRFVGEPLDEALVARAAAAFVKAQGDILPMLRVVMLDAVANPHYPLPPKLKRPLHLVTSAIRQLNAETDATRLIDTYLEQMGQVPYMWIMPNGYPDEDLFWSANLFPRWQFAYDLAQNAVGGTTWNLATLVPNYETLSPEPLLHHLATLLLGAPLPQNTTRTLMKSIQPALLHDPKVLVEVLSAGLMASPAFQWR